MATQARGSVDIKDNTITDAKVVSLAWSKLTGTPTTLAGYGIISPLDPALDVGGVASGWAAGQALLSGATDPNKRLAIGYATTENVGFIQPYRFGTGYDDLLLNPAGGNVGIGVVGSPASTFHVSAPGSTRLLFETTGGATLAGIQLKAGSSSWYLDNRGGADAPNDRIAIYDPSVTERVTILNGGNFGLGVTPTAVLHLKAGTAAASTAPFKLTSGTVLSSAEAGAIEFNADDFFATITTGPARKAFVLDNGARLSSGKIPIATTNGRLIDGQTPLSGTKVYYVSDTNGGAVDRKLTFIDGILTAET